VKRRRHVIKTDRSVDECKPFYIQNASQIVLKKIAMTAWALLQIQYSPNRSHDDHNFSTSIVVALCAHASLPNFSIIHMTLVLLFMSHTSECVEAYG